MIPHYKDGFIEDIHYYYDGSVLVFKEVFHIQRGQCCGNGCRHCPFNPKHKRNSTNLQEEYLAIKKELDNFS